MKLIRPGEQASPRGYSPRASSAHEKAVQAAIEKALCLCIDLECGHSVAVETNVFWSFGRPSADYIYCEKCDDWKHAVKSKINTEVPDNPMF